MDRHYGLFVMTVGTAAGVVTARYIQNKLRARRLIGQVAAHLRMVAQ